MAVPVAGESLGREGELAVAVGHGCDRLFPGGEVYWGYHFSEVSLWQFIWIWLFC